MNDEAWDDVVADIKMAILSRIDLEENCLASAVQIRQWCITSHDELNPNRQNGIALIEAILSYVRNFHGR